MCAVAEAPAGPPGAAEEIRGDSAAPAGAAPFEVVVFDWDGTLVDSTRLIAGAILQAAAEIGVADRALASHVIGLGLAQALALVVPDLPPARIPEFVASYHRHFRAAEDEIRLFDGIAELLRDLDARSVRLAIATGKTHAGLARSLQAAGLARHFAATRCADQTQAKPHPAMLLELAQELGVPPSAMLMIGDTTHDLQMAAAAGAPAVAVSYGAHPRAELERLQPLAICDSVAALRRWVLARLGPA